MRVNLRFYVVASIVFTAVTLIRLALPPADFSKVSAQTVNQKSALQKREDAYRANNVGVA